MFVCVHAMLVICCTQIPFQIELIHFSTDADSVGYPVISKLAPWQAVPYLPLGNVHKGPSIHACSTGMIARMQDLSSDWLLYAYGRHECLTVQVGAMICKRAEQLRAELVVMAKHDKGALELLLSGSCTDYCVKHCTAPLLVLRCD